MSVCVPFGTWAPFSSGLCLSCALLDPLLRTVTALSSYPALFHRMNEWVQWCDSWKTHTHRHLSPDQPCHLSIITLRIQGVWISALFLRLFTWRFHIHYYRLLRGCKSRLACVVPFLFDSHGGWRLLLTILGTGGHGRVVIKVHPLGAVMRLDYLKQSCRTSWLPSFISPAPQIYH